MTLNHAPRVSTTVLVVEDNVTDLKLARSVLRGAGYVVLEALSAEEAIQILKTEKPQVILSDLHLPRMDGITLTRQLKQAQATAEIPVIATTAYSDHFARQTTLDAGFVAYLVKPLNTRTLSDHVAAAAKRT